MTAVMTLYVLKDISFLIKERFEGTGLKSLILADLQPFTKYTARVRCGSHDHFYKWGDWSDSITFTTREDSKHANRRCPKKNRYLQNGNFTGEAKNLILFE